MKIKIPLTNREVVFHRGALRETLANHGIGPPLDGRVRRGAEKWSPLEIQRRGPGPPNQPPNQPPPLTPIVPATPPGQLPLFTATESSLIADVGTLLATVKASVETQERAALPKQPAVTYTVPKTPIARPAPTIVLKLQTRPINRDHIDASQYCGAIRMLDKQELDAAAAKLRKKLIDTDWTAGLPKAGEGKDLARWNSKLRSAQNILEYILCSRAPDAAIGCHFEEEPIGLFTLLAPAAQVQGKGMELKWAVTHPGAAGAGGALMERAVNISAARRHGGKLYLSALPGAVKAYKAYGFVPDATLPHQDGTRVTMSLDPSTPENKDTWVKQNGQWRLKQYLTKELAYDMAGVIAAGRRDDTSS